MAIPTAMGTAPATAVTCEATTYASALMIGTIAETMPYPMEVSSARTSAQPRFMRALRSPAPQRTAEPLPDQTQRGGGPGESR